MSIYGVSSKIALVCFATLLAAANCHSAPLSFAAEVLASGPIAYYRLNEEAGATINDSSGNARHGSVVGSLISSQPGSSPGGDTSIGFGNLGFIQLPGSWGGGAEVTIEAVYRQTGSAGGDFASIVGGELFVHLQTTSNPDGVIAVFTDRSGSPSAVFRDAPDYDLDVWHYLAITSKSDATYVVYDDFVYTFSLPCCPSTEDYSFIKPTSSLGIGTGVLSRYWEGQIDEVAIYDRALSTTELLAHYRALNSVPEPSTIGLVAAGLLLGFARRRLRPTKRRFARDDPAPNGRGPHEADV